MVRTTGPMMSLSASGTLADTVTFSTWKGRPYVRQTVIPTNPRSGGQVSVRAMLKFLSQEWASLSAPNKATWTARSLVTNISPFNAFIAYNCDRWHAFRNPSKADPATETGVAPAAPTTTVTPAVKELILSIADGAQVPDWGWLIFRSTVTGFTPSISSLVKIIARSATPTVYIDTGLTTATPYFYRIKGWMATGKDGTLEVEKTGTPT